MNIRKISVFCLTEVLSFSGCLGMDENPNFQLQNQQLPVVEKGIYYPARNGGSFIGNLGLLLGGGGITVNNLTVRWRQTPAGLIKGIAKGDNGDYIAVFVRLPQPERRWTAMGLISHPVVRVKFKHGESRFDTGIGIDYRKDKNLGIPMDLIRNLFSDYLSDE